MSLAAIEFDLQSGPTPLGLEESDAAYAMLAYLRHSKASATFIFIDTALISKLLRCCSGPELFRGQLARTDLRVVISTEGVKCAVCTGRPATLIQQTPSSHHDIQQFAKVRVCARFAFECRSALVDTKFEYVRTFRIRKYCAYATRIRRQRFRERLLPYALRLSRALW